MRSAIANAIKAGLKLLEGPQRDRASFIYRNGRYPCVPTTERRGTVVVLGSVEYEVSLSLLVRKEVMPSAITIDSTDISVDWQARDVLTVDAGADPPAVNPYAGRRVGKSNKIYRILAVRESPVGSHWTIDLGDASR